jgi:hypothetical protein
MLTQQQHPPLQEWYLKKTKKSNPGNPAGEHTSEYIWNVHKTAAISKGIPKSFS